MNGISHKQAIQLTHRRLDGMLKEKQGLLLEEHLASCASCRPYVSEMELLPDRLQREFHARWDEKEVPSQNMMARIQQQTRRVIMSNRVSFGLRAFAGFVALVVLGSSLNYIIKNLQNPIPNSATGEPAFASHPAILAIDSNSCKPYSEFYSLDSIFRPPGQLHEYELIQGTSLVDGDFVFEFWLYCDTSLKPDDPAHWSTIAGLAIASSWRYNGPKIEGENRDYYGFEPDIRMSTGWTGPLFRASGGVGQMGINLSEETIRQHIQQGTPVRFRVMVDSPLGRNGAIFSFILVPAESGLMIADLHAEHLTP